MKNLSVSTVLMLILPMGLAIGQQNNDSTGLPGDNFSLEGALELFKKSSSPEEFEKLLNTEDSRVNNLDLNGDGEIDYIKVIERREDAAHDFILQAQVSESENQDVAVIEIEKENTDQATLQIVGDEDLFGNEKIIEPSESLKSNGGTKTTNVTVNVWTWPAVRYVYGPSYRVWVSPWGWRSRPMWWRPWRPVRYTVFYPYHAPYRHRYIIVHEHRMVHAHRLYRPVRTTSVIVRTRHQEPINHYRSSGNSRSDNNRTSRTTTTRTTTERGRVNQRSTTVERSTQHQRSSQTPQHNSRSSKPTRSKRSSRGN